MATKYYVGSGSDWNTAANWADTSGGTGPPTDSNPAGSGDIAIFDASSGNCTLDAAAACGTLQIGRSGSLYAGTLDANDQNITIGTGGLDCTYGGSATLTMGSGTWNCDGNWDDADIGTKNYETSTVNMTGTSKTIIGGSSKDWYNLTIAEGASIELSANTVGRIDVAGDLTVAGSFEINDNIQTIGVSKTYNVTGTVSGSGLVTAQANTVSGTPVSYAVNTTVTNTSTLSMTGTLGGTWTFSSLTGTRTLTVSAGTRTFTGAVTFIDNGTIYTIDDSANPSWIFQGSVTVTSTGTLTWTKGSGTIKFNNATVDQTLTVPAAWANTNILELIEVDKDAGEFRIAGGTVYCNGFTLTDGDFDPNGLTLDSSNSVTINAGTRFFDGTDTAMPEGSKIIVRAGTLTLAGAA